MQVGEIGGIAAMILFVILLYYVVFSELIKGAIAWWRDRGVQPENDSDYEPPVDGGWKQRGNPHDDPSGDW